MVNRKFAIFLFIFIIILQVSLPTFSSEKFIKFSAVGDILLDRGIRMVIGKKGQDYPLKEIDFYLLNRDLVLGNLEGPLSERGEALDVYKRQQLNPWVYCQSLADLIYQTRHNICFEFSSYFHDIFHKFSIFHYAVILPNQIIRLL